jgi:two-component system sensor histidine kinase MprB
VTRRLTLRARLSLLTAVTVAVAVAGCAVASWFVTRDQLYHQLDRTLSTPGPPPGGGPPPPSRNPGGSFVDQTLGSCGEHSPTDPYGQFSRTMQIVRSDGTACPRADSAAIVVTAQDVQVARGKLDHVFHDGVTTTGVAMRVYTRRVPEKPGIAISVAERLSETEQSLSNLALLLVLVSAVGIMVAGTAGLLVARTGLRPVDRLTDTVEHIARTEDLDTSIPVRGDDEIARLSESFNMMTAALSSSRDHQRRLIADAGHELRTPLTSLRTNIDLLMRSEATGRPLPAGTRSRLLADVKAQLLELSDLVGDLLELARPDQQPAQAEVVALHELVFHAVERARLRGPSLAISVSTEPWFVHAVPGSLERAVVNLLDNAVKFSPPGGEIDVRLASGELTVRDHGPGIPAEDLPHVFERFWRSPSARSLPGSGLGLSIVARVVEETGGEITLRTAPSGGTEALLRLPGTPT